LIHYPSYLLYVAIFGRIELYFLPYVAINALYAARAFAGVACASDARKLGTRVAGTEQSRGVGPRGLWRALSNVKVFS